MYKQCWVEKNECTDILIPILKLLVEECEVVGGRGK